MTSDTCPEKPDFDFYRQGATHQVFFCFSIDLQNSNWNQKKLLCFLSDVKRRTMPNFVFQGRFSKLIGFFREINMTMYRRNLSSRLHGIYVWVRDGIVKGRTQSSAWLLATSGDANVSTASVRQHLSTTVYTLFFKNLSSNFSHFLAHTPFWVLKKLSDFLALSEIEYFVHILAHFGAFFTHFWGNYGEKDFWRFETLSQESSTGHVLSKKGNGVLGSY